MLVVVARGKRERIRPGPLCAIPLPTLLLMFMSLAHGPSGNSKEGKTTSCGHWQVPWLGNTPRPPSVPRTLLQTPGMEVDHTGGQVKPLTGRMSCVCGGGEGGQLGHVELCGQP